MLISRHQIKHTFHKLRHRSYSVTEILMAVIIAVSVCALGWYIIDSLIIMDDAYSSSTAISNHNSPKFRLIKKTYTALPIKQSTAANPNILQIPQLGIEIAVPDSIKDLTYITKTITLRNGNQGTEALLSTASLADAASTCSPSSMALGVLLVSNGQYPTASQDQYAALDYGQLEKQFSTFYVTYYPPNGGACSTSSSLPSNASSFLPDLNSSLSTIQQLH
jgi:hypothetical protein